MYCCCSGVKCRSRREGKWCHQVLWEKDFQVLELPEQWPYKFAFLSCFFFMFHFCSSGTFLRLASWGVFSASFSATKTDVSERGISVESWVLNVSMVEVFRLDMADWLTDWLGPEDLANMVLYSKRYQKLVRDGLPPGRFISCEAGEFLSGLPAGWTSPNEGAVDPQELADRFPDGGQAAITTHSPEILKFFCSSWRFKMWMRENSSQLSYVDCVSYSVRGPNVFSVSFAVYIYIYILYWILTLKQLLSFIRTYFSCYYLYVVQQQHIWSHPKMLINRTFKIKVGKNSLSMRKNIGIILDGTHAKQNKWEGLNLPILALKWNALKAYSIFPCRAFGYGVKHPSTLNVAPFFLSVLLSFFLSTLGLFSILFWICFGAQKLPKTKGRKSHKTWRKLGKRKEKNMWK